MKLINLFAIVSLSAAVIGCGGGCGGLFQGVCSENQAPIATGQIKLTANGNSIDVSWADASDDSTAAAALEYQVVYSTVDNISTIDSAIANGTVSTNWTKNINNAIISNLNWGFKYYVSVLVKDASAALSIYPVADKILEAQQQVLTNGGDLVCPTGTVMNGFGGRKGQIIDQLYLQCGSASIPVGSNSVMGPGMGGFGGSVFTSFFCPDGSSVKRIRGTYGHPWYPVDLTEFQVICSDNNATQSYEAYSETGSVAFEFSCAAGQKAIGFKALPSSASGSYAGSIIDIICK